MIDCDSRTVIVLVDSHRKSAWNVIWSLCACTGDIRKPIVQFGKTIIDKSFYCLLFVGKMIRSMYANAEAIETLQLILKINDALASIAVDFWNKYFSLFREEERKFIQVGNN